MGAPLALGCSGAALYRMTRGARPSVAGPKFDKLDARSGIQGSDSDDVALLLWRRWRFGRPQAGPKQSGMAGPWESAFEGVVVGFALGSGLRLGRRSDVGRRRVGRNMPSCGLALLFLALLARPLHKFRAHAEQTGTAQVLLKLRSSSRRVGIL